MLVGCCCDYPESEPCYEDGDAYADCGFGQDVAYYYVGADVGVFCYRCHGDNY